MSSAAASAGVPVVGLLQGHRQLSEAVTSSPMFPSTPDLGPWTSGPSHLVPMLFSF